MDKPDQQQHGNFVAFLNRRKQPGDKLPLFHNGRISAPGDKTEHGFALWPHEYINPADGTVHVMYNGETDAVSADASFKDQVAAMMKAANSGTALATVGNLKHRPRQIVLFPNRFREEAPDKERPHLWGAWLPAAGEPVVRISSWERKDGNGHAMLGGATSYPIPGKSEAEQQAGEPSLKELVDGGEAAQGMPRQRKGKGDDSRDEGR